MKNRTRKTTILLGLLLCAAVFSGCKEGTMDPKLQAIQGHWVDVNSEDTDGNTLAYVWLSSNPADPENNMLNAVLVKNGYADDVVYMPNNKYADVFMELRQEAATSNTGLWKNNDVQHAWN